MPRTIKARLVHLGLCAVSAVLAALPYKVPGAWPVAFIAFIPYFFTLDRKSSREAFILSTAMGLIYYTLIGWWLTKVSLLGFALTAAYLSLYFGVFGLISNRFFSPNDDWERTHLARNRRALFFLPAFWVALEYVRGWLITGFPWALLAYSQWKNPLLIQISDVTGAWGVSYFVFFVNVALFRLAELGRKKPAPPKAFTTYLTALVLVAAAVAGYGKFQLSMRDRFYADGVTKVKTRISVLQGNIPQDQKWNKQIKEIILEKYKQLLFMSAIEKSDLVVWPETSFPGFYEDEAVMAADMRRAIHQSKTDVLVGAPTMGDWEEGIRFFNSAILFNAFGQEKARYHKLHLVPFGEFVPLPALLGFIRDAFHIGHFAPGHEYTIFSTVTRNQERNISYKFGVLICYEDIFPNLVRNFCKRGADVMINMTNDAWFGKTDAPYQHAAASVFRAVENRVPVVRATNTGLSCFITPEGRVTASVSENGQEIFVSGYKAQDVYLKKGRSFYTRFGDLFMLLVFVLVFLAYRDKTRQNL